MIMEYLVDPGGGRGDLLLRLRADLRAGLRADLRADLGADLGGGNGYTLESGLGCRTDA